MAKYDNITEVMQSSLYESAILVISRRDDKFMVAMTVKDERNDVQTPVKFQLGCALIDTVFDTIEEKLKEFIEEEA